MSKVGRPSAYGKAILVKARKYLNIDRSGYKIKLVIVCGVPEAFPTIEGLSVYLGVSRQTIYEWGSDPVKKEFSYILEQIMAKQGRTLIFGGITEAFSSPITKMMLTKHGYRDSSEIDHTSKGERIGKGLSEEALSRLNNLLDDNEGTAPKN